MKNACDGVEMGHLTQALSHIRPAVKAPRAKVPPPDSKNPAFVRATIDLNAELTAEGDDRAQVDPAASCGTGKAQDRATVYDVSTGRVTFG